MTFSRKLTKMARLSSVPRISTVALERYVVWNTSTTMLAGRVVFAEVFVCTVIEHDRLCSVVTDDCMRIHQFSLNMYIFHATSKPCKTFTSFSCSLLFITFCKSASIICFSSEIRTIRKPWVQTPPVLEVVTIDPMSFQTRFTNYSGTLYIFFTIFSCTCSPSIPYIIIPIQLALRYYNL